MVLSNESFTKGMLSLLPAFYFSEDYKLGSPLEKYLTSVFMATKDIIANINGTPSLADPLKCPSEYLPTLCKSLGIDYIPTIEENYQRKFAANIGELYRRKGTYSAIEFLVRTLTGSDCELYYTKNSETGERALSVVIIVESILDINSGRIEHDKEIVRKYLPTQLPFYLVPSVSYANARTPLTSPTVHVGARLSMYSRQNLSATKGANLLSNTTFNDDLVYGGYPVTVSTPLYAGDKIDYMDSTYGVYRKATKFVLDGSEDEGWSTSVAREGFIVVYSGTNLFSNFVGTGNGTAYRVSAVCSCLEVGTPDEAYNENNHIGMYWDSAVSYFCVSLSNIDNLETFKSWLQSNPIELIMELQTSNFTAFSSQEQNDLVTLANTSILSLPLLGYTTSTGSGAVSPTNPYVLTGLGESGTADVSYVNHINKWVTDTDVAYVKDTVSFLGTESALVTNSSDVACGIYQYIDVKQGDIITASAYFMSSSLGLTESQVCGIHFTYYDLDGYVMHDVLHTDVVLDIKNKWRRAKRTVHVKEGRCAKVKITFSVPSGKAVNISMPKAEQGYNATTF